MYFNVVSNNAFKGSSRWDPSFFVDDLDVAFSSFPLVKIEKISSERKAGIEPNLFGTHLFNYIGLEHVEANASSLVKFSPRLGQDIKSRSKIYRLGDVLYGRLRPALNKVLAVDSKLTEGVCSNEFFVLVPNDLVRTIYLEFILTSPWVTQRIDKIVGGATLPRINIKDFKQLEVPLPPLSIQDKIVEFIIEQRKIRAKCLKEAMFLPHEIRCAVGGFISEGVDMNIKLSDYAESTVWYNPLPDLELKK
jgi:hypothetical protein